jgi:hypothetical protein
LLQDVAHPGEGHQVLGPRQRLGRRQLIAGFEVSIKCGIWVSTEDAAARSASRWLACSGWFDQSPYGEQTTDSIGLVDSMAMRTLLVIRRD